MLTPVCQVKIETSKRTHGGEENAHMGISEGNTVASSQKYARENSFQILIKMRNTRHHLTAKP